MTATIISNTPPFGALTNKTVANLRAANDAITRLQEAVAVAASGYEGTPGTEYEGDGTNFGVLPSDTPGDQGSAYAYAMGQLSNAWATFWDAALPSIQQIDNGVTLP
jgi:hypothetical protein